MKLVNNERQPVWRRPKDAIRIFGISPATLYRWIENETVRTQKIQGCRFVDVSEFLSLEPAHQREAEEESTRDKKVESFQKLIEAAKPNREELEAYVAQREEASK